MSKKRKDDQPTVTICVKWHGKPRKASKADQKRGIEGVLDMKFENIISFSAPSLAQAKAKARKVLVEGLYAVEPIPNGFFPDKTVKRIKEQTRF